MSFPASTRALGAGPPAALPASLPASSPPLDPLGCGLPGSHSLPPPASLGPGLPPVPLPGLRPPPWPSWSGSSLLNWPCWSYPLGWRLSRAPGSPGRPPPLSPNHPVASRRANCALSLSVWSSSIYLLGPPPRMGGSRREPPSRLELFFVG